MRAVSVAGCVFLVLLGTVGAIRDPVSHVQVARARMFEAHERAQELVEVPIEQHEEAVGHEDEIRRLLNEALIAHGNAHEALAEALAEAKEAQPGRLLVNPFSSFGGRSAGVDSVDGILHRLREESSFKLAEQVEGMYDELREVRLKLAGSLENSTMLHAEAEAGLSENGIKSPAAHAEMDEAFQTLVKARIHLRHAVELRQQIEALRKDLEAAIEREREARAAVTLSDCVPRMLEAEQRVGEVHAEVPVQMEYFSRALLMREIESRETDLSLVTDAERERFSKGAAKLVRDLFSLRQHTDASHRSCGRMQVGLGELVLLGQQRLYLKNYRCNPSAPRNATCSGNGLCSEQGECFCAPGWRGKDCGFETCPDGCSGHGFCDRGECRCEKGWAGATCSLEDCAFGKDEDGRSVRCSGQGLCERDNATQAMTCMCEEGWAGLACERPVCPFGAKYRSECSGRGTCGRDGACKCFRGFGGRACEKREVVHGVCNDKGGCVCDKGWNGAACDLKECPHMCTGDHGVCDGHTGKCYCKEEWRGAGCQYPRPKCPEPEEELEEDRAANATGKLTKPLHHKECSGRGLCRPKEEGSHLGVCVCPPGWWGPACQFVDCPDKCQNGRRGVCGKDRKCRCFTGFEGDGCEKRKQVPSKCGDECFSDCLHSSKCTVSRLAGKLNANRELYQGGERSAEEQEAVDELLRWQLPPTAEGSAGKMQDCFLSCTQQCIVERCWRRGAELSESD
mmetsp:Transcript_23749/g.76330  ORF Transcript_23749/g.76330 Transcript_23749/m.76330 type:complete len:738 (+) Transcript_23749:40-2253(+)